MILQHFLTATAQTDEREVRQAMAVALATEIPHNSSSYERFYARVLDELGRETRTASAAPTPSPAIPDGAALPAGHVSARLVFSH